MSKQDKYIFPSIFSYDEDGISIEFPDLPGCFTCAETELEALEMVKEAMALHLYGMEEEKEDIPSPSQIKNLKLNENQVLVFVDVWMPPVRDELDNQVVKKTLTIPRWLDVASKKQNVNYSRILQEALKKHLGLTIDKKTS